MAFAPANFTPKGVPSGSPKPSIPKRIPTSNDTNRKDLLSQSTNPLNLSTLESRYKKSSIGNSQTVFTAINNPAPGQIFAINNEPLVTIQTRDSIVTIMNL